MKRSKALSVVVTALTALICAALCVSVLSLYISGVNRRIALQSATEPLFTREAAGRCLLRLCPLFALWLAAVIAARLCGANPEKDWKARRPSAKSNRPAARTPLRGQEETENRRLLRGVLYLLAALLIALGALNGGLRDVLIKAVHICTECIGLG